MASLDTFQSNAFPKIRWQTSTIRAASGLAVFLGPKVLGRLPERWVRLAGSTAIAGFGVYSLIQALLW